MLARSTWRLSQGRRPETTLRRPAWSASRTRTICVHHFSIACQSCLKRPSPAALAISFPQNPRARLFTTSVPTWLVPPLTFTALLVTLWAYKCLMTVVFQDKIIYMPYMPPFTRHEKIDDYAAQCRPVEWEERKLRAADGTKVAACHGKIGHATAGDYVEAEMKNGVREVVICYFHGNGGSLPPRLPMLSNVLKAIDAGHANTKVQYSLLALSYRGYWTSSGRPSQKGIELDARALFEHAATSFPNARLLVWGQSLGAGVASLATASYLGQHKSGERPADIAGLILETPFTSIKRMLLALYPQKWLPYQYLHPFLWNHWDSSVALRGVAESSPRPRVMLLEAARDEVVPEGEALRLRQVAENAGLDVELRRVLGALHMEASTRREGQEALARFVRSVSEDE